MVDINFLSENKNGDKNKKNNNIKREFEWTKPTEEEIKKEKLRESPRKKEEKKSPVFTYSHKGQSPFLINKEKIDRSRQEVFGSLKVREEKGHKIEKEKQIKKEKSRIFSWLTKIFKKKKPSQASEEDLSKYLKDGENIKRAGSEPFAFSREKEQKQQELKVDKEKLLPKKEQSAKEEKIENKINIISTSEAKPAKKETGKKSFIDKLLLFFHLGGGLKKSEKIKTKEEDSAAAVLNKKEDDKAWENSNVLETNLIKGEVSSFFNWEKGILILIFYLAGVGILVGGSYAGLIIWEGSLRSETATSNRIDGVKKQIEPLEITAAKIALFQNRLKLVSGLLQDHIYWTNFFEFLEDGTMPNVSYASISGDVEGGYTFSAKAKNFRAMVDQVNFFRIKDYVKFVKVTEGSYSEQGEQENSEQENKDDQAAVKPEESIEPKNITEESLSFNLSLEVDPNIFTKGPYIDKIEPLSGPEGQYISIYGINFRKYQSELSSVSFFNDNLNQYVDANIDFPLNCAGNWWTNSFVVIKVPKLLPGNWRIAIKNREGEAIYEKDFTATTGQPGPGICLMEPNYGYKGKTFSVYGENFGSSDNKGIIKIDNLSIEPSTWSDNQITAEIPDSAQSGSIKLITGNKETSNNLPYIQLY